MFVRFGFISESEGKKRNPVNHYYLSAASILGFMAGEGSWTSPLDGLAP